MRRAAVIILLLLLPAAAGAMGVPERNGFTLELGIGLGFMHVFPEEGDSTNDVGLAPLSFSLGAFINNQMAIMFRASGVSNLEEVAGKDIVTFLLFAGVHFQYWITDEFFVSGGPGFASLGAAEAGDFFDTIDRERGFGLSLRGGFSFANWENHSLRVSLELFPSFFENGSAMGEAINFEWQWF
jgi:hypothetical protein